MLSSLRKILARARDRRGFTLIETLVAMVTGVVVTGALFTILEISVRQSSHLSDVAQATQVGRTAMNKLTAELHSACLSSGFMPVIKGSTANKLIFVNGYNEKETPSNATEPPAELFASAIHKDVVEYESGTGRIVDKTYKASSNAPQTTAETKWERYPWNATPSATVKLAEHVSPVTEVVGGKEVKKPIFEYFAYNTSSQASTSQAASTLDESASLAPEGAELTESGANKTASVLVSFRTAPYSKEVRLNKTVEQGTFADLSSQTLFALGTPNSEATIQAGPCE